jgi:hypothetical protein
MEKMSTRLRTKESLVGSIKTPKDLRASLPPQAFGAHEITEAEANIPGYVPERVLKQEKKDAVHDVAIKQGLNPHEREVVVQEQIIPMIGQDEAQSEVEELENMFQGDGQTESSILKELFNSKNIKVKTDLTEDQISIVSRLFLMAHITKRPYLHTVLNEFITLRVSKDRKSRTEFVEAHKDRNQQQGKGLMGLFGGGGQ